MRYVQMGRLPAKRHTQFRENGTLLVEEVMGYEGFSGNESILYHLNSPCRLDEVGQFRPLVKENWVPDAHVHRLADPGEIGPSERLPARGVQGSSGVAVVRTPPGHDGVPVGVAPGQVVGPGHLERGLRGLAPARDRVDPGVVHGKEGRELGGVGLHGL